MSPLLPHIITNIIVSTRGCVVLNVWGGIPVIVFLGQNLTTEFKLQQCVYTVFIALLHFVSAQ